MYQLTTAPVWTLVLNGGSTNWSESASGSQNTWAGPVTLNGAATLDAANVMSISGDISGVGSINKVGTSSASLSGNNSYDGVTTVSAGVLNISHANGLGTTAGNTTVASASALRVSGGAVVAAESVTVAGPGSDFFGALQAGTGGGTWGGQVTLGDNAVRLGAQAVETLAVTGSIVDGAGTNISVSGASGTGTVILNPATANTYSGVSGIIRGILRLGKDDALPTGTTLDIDSVSSISDAAIFDMAGFNQTVAALQDTATSSLGSVVTNSATSDPSTLTVTGTSTFDGIIKDGAGSSTVSLVKSTGGTLTLKGVNTYTGDTTVSGGTLQVNSPGSLAAGSAVTVSGTGTLGGNGTVNGTITIQSGGTLSPGASIGTLTASHALTLAAGSTTLMEVDRSVPTSDAVTGITTLTQGGTLQVSNTGPSLQDNDEFPLLSAATYTGEFAAISPSNPNSDEALAWDTLALQTNGLLRVHQTPVAADKAYARARGLSLKIPLSDLFSATDGDGDPVRLEALPASTNGATLATNATYLFYTPANDLGEAFSYTATDGRGGRRTRQVTILVTNSVGVLTITNSGGGSLSMSFYGIPGLAYVIQRSSNLVDWVDVVTNTAAANGLMQLTETPPHSPAFYRTRTE
jgi:autotransporter-associated beta strand protein